jgi:hypothetical protein
MITKKYEFTALEMIAIRESLIEYYQTTTKKINLDEVSPVIKSIIKQLYN